MQQERINLSYYDKNTLDKIIKENLNFSFNIYSKNSSIEQFKKSIIYLMSNNYDLDNKQVIINLDTRDYYLKKEQLVELKKCEKLISIENGSLLVNDGNNNLWGIDNIIFANNKIDNVVTTIKSLRVPDENNRPLNDIEKIMTAYLICSQFRYNENDDEKMKARTITSIFNDCKDIVCVGYTSIFLELCSRLDIKCYRHFCNSSTNNHVNNNVSNHVNNVIVLDKKIFYNDVCWDSVREGDNLNKFNFFMLPYKDKNNLNCNIHTLNIEDDPYVNIINDKKVLKLISLIPNNESIPKMNKEQASNIYFKYSHEFTDINYFDDSFDDATIRNECNILLQKLNEFTLDYTLPIEEIEKTIYNLNRANGMPKVEAKSLAKQIIEFNINNSVENYKASAINSFNQSYINQVENNITH